MATFIPEWPRVSGRNLHIKRVLNTLDDACAVRRPFHSSGWVPDLFVQHPNDGWLAIAVCDAPFSSLDTAQLFDVDGQAAFEQLLGQFSVLDGIDASTNHKLAKLMLMWSCSIEETRTLSVQYVGHSGVRLLSKEQFVQLGEKIVPRLLAQVDEDGDHALLGHYFPETEIPTVCTTRRRDFHRDNSAKLTRFFLDVEQEWASKLDLEPPKEQTEAIKDASVRLVNGVAGSGKTLIALNRARLLAQMFPEQRILMLIHNTPIVADIKARMHRAYGEISGNLEITTFYAWAVRQWRNLFRSFPHMPQKSDHVPDLVKHYRAQWADLKPTDAQLVDEFDFINESLIADESQYQTVSRSGQRFALRAKERTQVWTLYETVAVALAKSRLQMWSAVPHDICLSPNHERLEQYHHIIVDEAQFFAPSWFQVLKLSLKTESHLFLCADPNQGFMKSRLSWKSVGLDVAGRTKKLRKSYRTTRTILQAASRVLAKATQGDPEDFLEPDFDGMEPGMRPILIYVDSPQDAVDRVVNEVAVAIQEGLPLSSLLVIYGDKVNKSMLVEQIGREIGLDKVWWLNRPEHKKLPPNGYGQDYLRVVYLGTATGLEASVVFLVGMENLLSAGLLPEVSEDEHAQKQEEQARKLYMAMTRAGQRLILVSSQRLPDSIEGVFQRIETEIGYERFE